MKPGIAHAHPGAQIGGMRREAHALLAAREHDLALPGPDLLSGEGHRAETGTADLVDAEGGLALGDAGQDGGLACRILPLRGGEHLAEDHLVHLAGFEPGLLQRRAEGGRTQLMRRYGRERAAEAADRRPLCGHDDDVVHSGSPWLRFVSIWRGTLAL